MRFRRLSIRLPKWAQHVNISGTLYDTKGTPISQTAVHFKIEVRDKSGSCVLYSEEHLNQDLATTQGAFNIDIGTGTNRVNYMEGGAATFMRSIFENKGSVTVTGCGSVTDRGGGVKVYTLTCNS